MSAPLITVHADPASMADVVATHLAALIAADLARRDAAWLALAGGSTPLPVYRRLAALPLPWTRVHLLPTDERWVPGQHPARNDAALRRSFGAATGVRVHRLVAATPGAAADTAVAAGSLRKLGPAPFAAVVLGMGSDAHIASLFPVVTPDFALDPAADAQALALSPKPLPTEAPFPRVSLTLGRLLRAHWVGLMLVGAAKRELLEASIASCGRPLTPLQHLLAAAPQLAIHWSKA